MAGGVLVGGEFSLMAIQFNDGHKLCKRSSDLQARLVEASPGSAAAERNGRHVADHKRPGAVRHCAALRAIDQNVHYYDSKGNSKEWT